MAGGIFQTLIKRGLLYALGMVVGAGSLAAATPEPTPTPAAAPGFFRYDGPQGDSSRSLREKAIAGLPTSRLTRQATERILAVAKSPTIYRRLPSQAIDCDRDMFLFLARNPEVMVGMWELMGITKVRTKRLGPYQLDADDGSGTKCNIDLVYGDPNVHIYMTEGSYDGMLTPKPLRGKGVVILNSSYADAADGRTTVTGTIDFFMQVDSLGIDLVARTLSGLIGRSADYNFVETARFVGQISQASERNPPAMIDVANRMPQISHPTRQKFIGIISELGAKSVLQNRMTDRPVVMSR